MRASKRSLMTIFVLATSRLIAGDPPAGAPRPGEPVLRHSEVVFMYAARPEDYKAYGATFVAWGGAETRERVKMHRDLGIRSTGSVWWDGVQSEA